MPDQDKLATTSDNDGDMMLMMMKDIPGYRVSFIV